jgi:acyl-CoA synthetase (NDP forming)
MTASNLRAALNPQSVAVVGASDNPDKVGGRPVDYLRRFGFAGPVWPINPARRELQGLRCFESFEALPDVPELVVVAVGGEPGVQAVERAAAAGSKVTIVMASGYGETGTADGKALEARMVGAARAHGMRVIGPNTQGLANFASGTIASFSTMFKESPPAPRSDPGHVAMLSQSGALSVVPYGFLRRRGIGVRHAHSTGNDADVTVAELAAAVAEDDGVKLLLLYLEGMPDPEHLAQMAAIARARRLPVLALKSGRTPAGQQAARSHTGALASEDKLVDAFFEQHGIWRAQTIHDLVDGAELYLKGWRPRGRRTVVVSNSGAFCVLAADAASQAGLPLAQFSDTTLSALRQTLPSFATITNPIDITGALLSDNTLYARTLQAIASDANVDAFVVGFPVAGGGYDLSGFAQATVDLARGTDRPVLVAASQPSVAAAFSAQGIPTFDIEAQAITALAQWLDHHARIDAATPPPSFERAALRRGEPRLLHEAASLQRLAAFGVPVVAHRLCTRADEAVAAFDALGGAVAVKGCSHDVAHKTELQLVRLNLRTADDVRAAFADQQRRLQQAGHAFDGVIVAAMARGRRELMIGAKRDPVFGPVIVLGDGGPYVEAMPDAQLLLPPLSPDRIRTALQRLRIALLFRGVRGQPPLSERSVIDAALAVERAMADPRIESLDINPLLVGAVGEPAVALDAVVYEIG